MKTTKILFVALIMGLFTATTVQAQEKMKSDMKTKQMAKEMYVCPMHPDEKSEEPGKCPQCGMNMNKMNMNNMHMNNMHMNKVEMKSDMKTEQMAKEMYVCPMHSDEKSEGPGKCSQCGMDMKKMEMKKDKDHKH